MIIHSYEDTRRAATCAEYLNNSPPVQGNERIILLPIPTTRDNTHILNTNIYIYDVLNEICEGDVVCGYGLPSGFCAAVTEKGARVTDLSLEEEFLLENADLTALCSLLILAGESGRAYKDMKIGVVGYGRIGKRLLSLLLFLGSDVRLFTGRPCVRDELCELGVDATSDFGERSLSGLDALVNTAPSVIFDPAQMPPKLRVIDLASGDNFPGAPQVEKYPSVPSVMFPVSAGIAWGRAVERFLINNP